MTHLVHLADRLLNRPLLITPDKAAMILSVLSGRIGISSPEASRFFGDNIDPGSDGQGARPLPYRRTAEGVGVITILGSLVNRGAWVGASSGLTSYEGIKFQLAAAGADSKVHSVILDIDSSGGEATGCFECAEAVRSLAAIKPVIAVVNGMAYSSAYALASGATEIVTTETSGSGSIGVLVLHADRSRAIENEGIKPTYIFAGAHKVDGNPFEALSDEVRDSLQTEINAFYDLFLATVARGRGSSMTADMARATEARTFIGKDAVACGLADRLGTFESVLAELSRTPARRSSSKLAKGATMSNQSGGDPAELSTAEYAAALASARTEGVAAGRAAAMSDIKAIMASEEAKGREASALALALDGLSASTAQSVLATLPKTSGLAARMAADPVPSIGGETPVQPKKALINSREVYAARRALRGA